MKDPKTEQVEKNNNKLVLSKTNSFTLEAINKADKKAQTCDSDDEEQIILNLEEKFKKEGNKLKDKIE